MFDEPLHSVSLAEECRPRRWEDVVGHDKALATISRLRAGRGLAGRAYWITGTRGSGKGTIAALLAEEVADSLCIRLMPVGRLTESAVHALADELQARPLPFGGKTGKVVIVNEAHKLREDAITALLDVIDPQYIPPHVTWIFTAPAGETQDKLFADHDDAKTLVSRCTHLELSQRGLAEAFAARVKADAEKRGLDGQPIEKYIRLAKDCRNNCREMYSRVEAGCMLKEGK